MTTSEMNSKLEIKYVKNLKVNNGVGYSLLSEPLLFIIGLGYVAFSGSELPYRPCGGIKALKAIIDGGGFENYKGIHFVNPVL